jgi:transcriptional regulator with XRE-family HTH domain
VARTPATEYFGSELRRAREAAGMSREEFGTLVNYAPSTVGAFETGERFPSRSLTAGADEYLKTDGVFARMLEKLLTGYVHPEWFRPWSDIEQHATAIRSFEPNLVPGLLQTGAYAKAVLGGEEATAARLARQHILTRGKPPELIVIVDESVLHRQVATPEAMHEQLLRLGETSACVQVVPYGDEYYPGLAGPFVLAAVDGREYVHLDTAARGFVLDSAEIISEMRRQWDVLRGEALPPRQSRDLILKVAETWKRES